jgi:eukaryotic-like serine/threonine-protein kinase
VLDFCVVEGASIGSYRITSKIGEGGMGTVWVGEHTLLGRRAAIKVLLPEYSNREEIVQRFFNEARAVTAISDPGIVQVFDFGHALGSAYIVMELLTGEAMDARLRRIGRFAPADAIRLMAQVATSLGAAHAKGVIHRDLKPENIFIVGDPAVTGGERTKILDFGIAKLAGVESSGVKTRTGMMMGTPVYMSPEQCRGASTIDARSDIYSLGCVLFTMLCGRPPFESDATGDLIIMHVRDAPPAPSSLVPGLLPELDALLACCLEKDPNRRYQTTNDLVQALAAAETALFATPAGAGANDQRRPAAGLAYRQRPTPAPPDAHTRIATPMQGPTPTPTTLSSANGAAVTAAPARRSSALWVGVAIALLAIAGGVFALVARGDKDVTPAAAASESPPPVVAAPADAATVAVPEPPAVVDAAVAEPSTPAVATEQVDAGVVATTPHTTDKKRDKRKTSKSGNKQGSNASSTSSGTFDRGD